MINKRKWLVTVALLLIYLSSGAMAAAEENARLIIKNVLKKYDEIKNLKAEFSQKFYWKLTDNVNEQQGVLWLEGKEKFRIKTDDQEIVSNGKTIWTYSKTNNQVIVDNVQNSEDINLPRDILLKYVDKYKPKYIKQDKIDNQSCHLLELTARDENSFIKQMKIWIDSKKSLVIKIEQIDLNDNVNTYILSHIETDLPLPADFFDYKIPESVEVIDMR